MPTMTELAPSRPPGGAGRTVGDMGERALLRYLRSRIPGGSDVVVGVGDDAAAVRTADGALILLTTDSLVEGVHFRMEWSSAYFLGRKALSINLSDIAAMAGVPHYATISLCLPRDVEVAVLDELYDGLLERAAETGVQVVGGNLSGTSGAMVVDVTLLGHVDRPIRRAGARPGDLVVVTGTLGAAEAALPFLEQGARLGRHGRLEPEGFWSEAVGSCVLHCLRALLDPAPPLDFGRAVGEGDLVHAAIDLSDGISGDLMTLCQESEVSAQIDSFAVPVDPAAIRLEKEGGRSGFSLALHGGEDYQMLMAVAPERLDAIQDLAASCGVSLSVIGEFAPGPPALYVQFGERIRQLKPQSHDHFADPYREPRSDPSRES